MNPLAREWLLKADDDLNVAQALMRMRRLTSYDAVCFHSQQTAERSLKAFLTEHQQAFPKTHDLVRLNALCEMVDPLFVSSDNRFAFLDEFSVKFRYPGESADRITAKQAVQYAQQIKTFVRSRLGLT